MRKLIIPVLLCVLSACSEPPVAVSPDAISIESSIDQLSDRFEWAKEQALAYAHEEGDSVGLWYEAALPNREAFCMRDVSHQALGAHFLGLDEHTRNMLFRFARNISEGKDWCSFWEINRMDEPAPVDYRDDKAFWYNLPANFDVLDASYRMYLWTGDLAYVEHPVFLEFYERTVSDYVAAWDLDAEVIVDRQRYMNRETFNLEDPYEYARGIPSYHEGNQGSTQLGIDLLAFQVAAYRSYAAILEHKGQPARAKDYLSRAVRVSNLINEVFWNEETEQYADLLQTDGELAMGGGMLTYALYNDAIFMPDRANKTALTLMQREPSNIEIRSHYPEVLFKYGMFGEALDILMQLSADGTPRREYPEVSFAVIGAITTGLMGLTPIDKGIGTLSRIPNEADHVSLRQFQHRGIVANLTHEGQSSSTLSVESGGKLYWRAMFNGDHPELAIDGKRLSAVRTTDQLGNPISYIEIDLFPNDIVTISVPE